MNCWQRELMNRADICYLTKSDAIVIRQIERCGFKTIKLNDDNEVANLVQEIRPDMVVIDKPDVDEAFAESLKRHTSAKLVIFSNLPAEKG